MSLLVVDVIMLLSQVTALVTLVNVRVIHLMPVLVNVMGTGVIVTMYMEVVVVMVIQEYAYIIAHLSVTVKINSYVVVILYVTQKYLVLV